MKLLLHTNIEDRSWLTYIVEEFLRIQSADFHIDVVSYIPEDNAQDVLYYNSIPQEGITLFCSSHLRENLDFTFKDEILLAKGTISRVKGFGLDYDLLWNAFIHLSRIEEYQSERKNKNILSYASRHPRNDKENFNEPWVNLLFQALEDFIVKFYPRLKFSNGAQSRIELSHDLDYINKTIQLRLKQTAFNGFNFLKALVGKGNIIQQLKKTSGFLFSNPDYWCFDYWEELEANVHTTSTFYIYSRMKVNSFKAWMIDPSYHIYRNLDLQNKLKELKYNGWNIGLHGSYFSANDPTLLSSEKEQLESALDMEITRTRQHWLNFSESTTPYAHEGLFDQDSTIGWNDRMGFRAGCASRYRPYDHKNNRAFDYWEVPQVIMDSNIYDYGSGNSNSLISVAKDIIRRVCELKNGHIAISWHPRTCSSDYNWQPAYKQLIAEAAAYDGLQKNTA